MVWIDQFSLPAIIIAPLLGALFLVFIPHYEVILRKKVALFVITGLILLEARLAFLLFNGKTISIDLDSIRPLFLTGTFLLRIDFLACALLFFLLLVALFLFYCPLSKVNQNEAGLHSKTLFLVSLMNASILASNFGFTLLLQLVVMQFILIFNLRGNGPHRGSTALTTAVFFTLVDLVAYFMWTWSTELSAWIQFETLTILILLPAISRLCVPFFSPWARGLFANSSAEITILVFITSSVAGINSLARIHIESPFLSTAAAFAGFFAAILALSDKPLSQFLIRISCVSGSLVLFTFTISRKTEFEVVVYALGSVVIVALALLIQRAIFEDNTQRTQSFLYPLWLLVLGILVTLPWSIFPMHSTLWVVTYSLVVLSACLRVRAPLDTGRVTAASITARLSALDIANTWALSCILIAMVFALQFFIWKMDLAL